ncbi:MAG: GDP-mannose 4,6-dehydratase [Chloroflexi bacterium]|nr:GDP-mannose 4,6-dehydratase [Chloroflexota bacterium]
MKILVTGGAGFIGSNLTDQLLLRGDEVVAVDNLSTGRRANIEHLERADSFTFVEGSILDEPLMNRLIQQSELVYHLAAAVGVKYIVDDPLTGILTNVMGTEVVFRLAHRYGAKVLFASTSELYGKRLVVPFSEDDDRLIGPTQVPRWSYSSSKALDEHLAFAYRDKGLTVTIVRYCNAFGPRTDIRGYGSVIARFIGQAMRGEPLTVYGGGWQTRCFTFVADTVRGTIAAANSEAAEGEVFNIGSNDEISISELARRIVRLTDSPSEVIFVPFEKVFGPHFEDTVRRVPNVARARETFGFAAEVPLDDGLRRTIAWFREHPHWGE